MGAEPTIIPLTVRKLKPGTYEEWRKAWHDSSDPDALWVEQESKAYILRSLEDPNEVVAFGFLEGSLPELQSLRQDPEVERKQRRRQEAMAPFVSEILLDGAYEVIEVVTREDARQPGA